MTSRLIDGFGGRDDVQKAFERKLHTTGVVSSLADHYARYLAPLKPLQEQEKPEVRRWARRLSRELRQLVDHRRTYEEERMVGLG